MSLLRRTLCDVTKGTVRISPCDFLLCLFCLLFSTRQVANTGLIVLRSSAAAPKFGSFKIQSLLHLAFVLRPKSCILNNVSTGNFQGGLFKVRRYQPILMLIGIGTL